MVVFPNAKINIGLNIIEKRSDNFHNLDTLFYPVPVKDVLEILPEEEGQGNISVKYYGFPVDGDPLQNLCVKAYQLLDAHFNLPGVKIILQKSIPLGAGLGGGSSDAAFTIVLLNRLFNLGLSLAQMEIYASELGSDCAFFIRNTPAIGSEKGNVLEEINLDLKGYYFILVKPNVHVSTNEAYSNVKPIKPEFPLKELLTLPVKAWKNKIKNDFEDSIFPKHPEIKRIKDELYKHGAIYASMSGSGSSVYGLFETKKNLKENFKGMFFWEGML